MINLTVLIKPNLHRNMKLNIKIISIYRVKWENIIKKIN